MKRSVVISMFALAAGLLLAITATAAPFRDYRQSAADQYTTTVGATVTVGGQGTSTPTPPTTTTTTTTETPDSVGENVTDSDNPSGEDDGSGAAPDEDSGAGAPIGPGVAGTGAGSGRAATAGTPRGTVGVLSIGFPSTKLSTAITAVTGTPAWGAILDGVDVNALGDAAAGTPFAGLGEGDLDMDKFRGVARRLGGNAVTADGLATGLPDLLGTFAGEVKPLTALVLTYKKLEDEDQQRLAESFVRSFARGAVTADVPVVGVELDKTKPSSIPFFKKIKGVSSVDDVDTQRGATSLARLLQGAEHGHYGRRKGVDAAQAPVVDPDTASARLSDAGGTLGDSPLLVGVLLAMGLMGGRALMTVAQRVRA